jgi:hypothetical protein
MGKTSKRQTVRLAGAINADGAKRLAIEYCLFHYPTLYTGGVPRCGTHRSQDVWIVPIMLEDPGAGISEPVGELCVDARTERIVISTPAADVVAAGKRLYEERCHAHRAAAVSSRKDR